MAFHSSGYHEIEEDTFNPFDVDESIENISNGFISDKELMENNWMADIDGKLIDCVIHLNFVYYRIPVCKS